MAHRLTKIYTRTGDAGDTGTASGARVAKDDVLIQVQGDVDELNSILGVLASKLTGEQLEIIREIQHTLFDIGGEISLAQPLLKQDKIAALEHHIDTINLDLAPLKEFILPGGNEVGALCHLGRAVCRRVERSMVTLNRRCEINHISLAYINRLSDLLFVFARALNDADEIYWNSKRIK